jgi:hypothetical protein
MTHRSSSWQFIHLYIRLENFQCVEPIKVKIKLSLCFNWAPRYEDVLGTGGTDPRILDLSTRWSWVVSFAHRPLYPKENSPWYPLDRRLGGPQSRSGRGGKGKNSQPLPGLEPPIMQPVTQGYITELYRHQPIQNPIKISSEVSKKKSRRRDEH